MSAETEPRVWRQRRNGAVRVLLVVAVVILAAAIVHVVAGNDDWPWLPWLWLVVGLGYTASSVGLVLQRTVADEAGLRQPAPGLRAATTLAWSDIIDVRPNAPAAWADHVVVETGDGSVHRLQMIPASDVEEVRSRWAAWGGGPVGDHP